jgi:hypothetical protein
VAYDQTHRSGYVVTVVRSLCNHISKNRPTAGENGERRINTWVTTSTALALTRLARHYGVTRRVMLERLVADAERWSPS